MSSKSDYIRWWTNYGEMANEEIEYPAFQAGRAFQHSVESSEIATLRAQLAEAREIIEPFAAEAGMWGSKTSDDETPIIKGSDGKGDEAAFTVGDLRKAQKWYDKVITA